MESSFTLAFIPSMIVSACCVLVTVVHASGSAFIDVILAVLSRVSRGTDTFVRDGSIVEVSFTCGVILAGFTGTCSLNDTKNSIYIYTVYELGIKCGVAKYTRLSPAV